MGQINQININHIKREDNPFRPGFDVPPPYLAGRDEESRALLEAAESVVGGRSEGVRDIVLYGPRGTGKSSLLTNVIRQITTKKLALRIVSLPAQRLSCSQKAIELLVDSAKSPFFSKLLVGAAGVTWKSLRIELKEPELSDAMARRLAKQYSCLQRAIEHLARLG